MMANVQPNTREALLDAAIHVLMAEGWASLNMRTLAGSLGIQAPSIYYHFRNKADLGLAMIEHLRLLTLKQVEEISALSISLEEKITLFASIEHLDATYEQSCPVYNLQAEYPLLPENMQEALRSLVELMLQSLQSWIHEAVLSEEISGDIDEAAQAAMILSICEHGLQLQRVTGHVQVNRLISDWAQRLIISP